MLSRNAWICALIALTAPGLASAQVEEPEEAPMAAPAPQGGGAADTGGGPGDASAADDSATEEVAADDGGDSDTMAEPTPDSGGTEADPTQSGMLTDEQVLAEEQMGDETVRSSTDPYEDPTRNYYSLGLFYHHNFTPLFILNLFTDDATGANNPSFGLEFTYRKDGFDIIISGWWQSFFVDGAFRGPGDDIGETEIIDSNLSTVFLGATFLWGTAFNDVISLQYGLSVGLGAVLGSMYRTEAYRDGDGWGECEGPGVPDPGFCDPTSVPDGEEGGHFQAEARNWIDGGSVPVVWIRIAPQLSLRIKPIKQLIMRIDAGFDIFSGFYVGGALAYGFGG